MNNTFTALITIYLIMGCLIIITWIHRLDPNDKIRIIPFIMVCIFGMLLWPIAWYKGNKSK